MDAEGVSGDAGGGGAGKRGGAPWIYLLLAAAGVAIGVLLVVLVPAPTAGSAAGVSPEAEWLLKGTLDERLARVAKHLRGLDVAMAEIGYRYGELYFAGRDRNWEYAEYQLGKIEVSLTHAVERRPKRAESAKVLASGVDPVRRAIAGRDPAGFETAFAGLTVSCNACHRAERVPFMVVAAPQQRSSPIVFTNGP